MARPTLAAALALMALAIAPLTHAASTQPTQPVVVMASASLKLVGTRAAMPAAPAKSAALASTIGNDGDRFRYDSCGCSAP